MPKVKTQEYRINKKKWTENRIVMHKSLWLCDKQMDHLWDIFFLGWVSPQHCWHCDTEWVRPMFDTFTVVQMYSVFRRLLSGHDGSSGGIQRSQLCPKRPGALCPSALVYQHYDASTPGCWCNLNRQEEDEPDAHLHTADIETWRQKKRNISKHNIALKK